MRAVIADDAAAQGVSFADVPATASDTDVHLRVRAISLNRGESNALLRAAPGWRPGWDVAGDVLHDPGGRLPTGTPVVGFVPGGGWAEEATARYDELAELPSGVSYTDAAALPIAGLTAKRTLDLAGPEANENLLVHGASGGVGGFAVQLAKLQQIHVTAIASARHHPEVYALGADQVHASFEDAHGPFDAILDSTGGSALAHSLTVIRAGGTVVTFGNTSSQRTTVDIVDFYRKSRARLLAFAVTAPSENLAYKDDLQWLLAKVADNQLDPRVHTVRPWTELASALKDLRDRRASGKTVLTIDP